MSPYLNYVKSIADGITEAAQIPQPCEISHPVLEREKKVMLFSPHPDDECITGLLPRRLQLEQEYQVINVPMTFGSKLERREARLTELEHACGYLGWQNLRVREDLENLTVDDVAKVLLDTRPDVIVFPHERDWNSRHIEVHHVLMKALDYMPQSYRCLVVETEFWGAMDAPNAHVEASVEHVTELLTATSYHEEEVARNAYHLRLPAWMQDNVRRGAELVGGQGEKAPAFLFSTLYRIRSWREGRLELCFDGGQVIPHGAEHLKRILQ